MSADRTGGGTRLNASNSPRFSVVIPAYNVERFLGRTIASVLNQTHPAHEVIVVDDGSTDDTASVVQHLGTARRNATAIILLRQENSGVSVARNNGLAGATGDYVIFLDGDDWVEPDLFETLSNYTARRPDMLHWRFRQVDEQGDVVPTFESGWTEVWPSRSWDKLASLLKEEVRWLWLGATAWRRDFLLQHGFRFAEGCATAEDSEFMWSALMLAGGTVYVDQVLSNYLLRDGSVTQSLDLRRFDGCMAYSRLAHRLRNTTRVDREILASLVADRAVRRYFVTIEQLVNVQNVFGLWRAIERREPGISASISAALEQRRARGLPVKGGHALHMSHPWLVPYRALARRWLSRLEKSFRWSQSGLLNQQALKDDSSQRIGNQ